MPQNDHRRLRLADSAGRPRRMARARRRRLARRLRASSAATSSCSASKLSVRSLDEVVVEQVLVDDHVHQRVVEGDVGAGLDAAVALGVVGDISAGAGRPRSAWCRRLRACLKKVAATGWFAVVLEPVISADVGVLDVAEDVRHRAASRSSRAAPPRSRRGTAACSGRRCSCRSPRASASGTGRPLRCEHLALPKPASAPAPCSSRISASRAATRSSASSQVASRKAGSTSS